MRKKFDKAENWKNRVYIAVDKKFDKFTKIIEMSEYEILSNFWIKENKSGKTFITGNFDGAEFYGEKAFYSPIKLSMEKLIDLCVDSWFHCENFKIVSEKEAEQIRGW